MAAGFAPRSRSRLLRFRLSHSIFHSREPCRQVLERESTPTLHLSSIGILFVLTGTGGVASLLIGFTIGIGILNAIGFVLLSLSAIAGLISNALYVVPPPMLQSHTADEPHQLYDRLHLVDPVPLGRE